MTKTLDLDSQMRSTQDRLLQMQQQLAAGSADPERLLTEALAELAISLEELHVASEELHGQNAELLATRQGLEAERQSYQNLFNFAPDAYLVTDGRGTIQAINDAASELLAVRRDFGIGKPLILFVDRADHLLISAQLELVAQSIQRGRSRSARQSTKRLPTLPQSDSIPTFPAGATILLQAREVSLQPRKQAVVPALMSLSVEFARQGDERLYWLFHDLRASKQLKSERQQAEMAQTIREQAALLDITSDAIFVCDLDHHILYWNQGAERLYGWSAAAALGRQAHELLQADADQFAASWSMLLVDTAAENEHRGEWRGEIRQVTQTGKEMIVDARWTLVRDEAGQPKSILMVNTDITEQKQLEAQFYQAQRLESLGTLASGIAHDLNNVLTPILALAQVLPLHQSNLDRRSLEMLTTIEQSAQRGANIVQQILTFTRGPSGERTTLQITPILHETIDIIQQTCPQSLEQQRGTRIAIDANIPDNSLWTVVADPNHLHQILMNLCVNARDAMPDGGKIAIAAENFYVDRLFAQMSLNAEIGNYVLITVTDTGTGIHPAVRERIFEPFFTTKQQSKGTGLGLSTVLGIVRSYGGFVQVASELGQGSQFKVYLPAAQETVAKSEPEVKQLQGHGELVMIVEDDLAVQEANRALLESYEYQTLVANDGIEAIALYAQRQHEIAVVLMDMMMPNLDGIKAIRTLIAMNPQVKIVAMSGVSSNRSAALAAGAKIFLAKPYTLADLVKSLANLVINSSDDRHQQSPAV